MAQNDQLDREALDYLQEKNIAFAQQIPSDKLKAIAEGGKRGSTKTHVPDRIRQARKGTYISDEPDRFVQYIGDLKGQFISEEDGIKKIQDKFENDPSLKNLINGLEKEWGTPHLRDEIRSILQTEQAKGWFNYALIAKRLKIPLSEFNKRVLPKASSDKIDYFNTLLFTKKKVRLRYEDLYVSQKTGTIKGQTVAGRKAVVKIFSKKVIRYRDAKGRFIKE